MENKEDSMKIYIDNNNQDQVRRRLNKKAILAALLFGVVGLVALTTMDFSHHKTELFQVSAEASA
jgi:uncharacterized membrane protein YsdA (DUF1294 family)